LVIYNNTFISNLYNLVDIFLDSLGGRDFDSLSASLGVRSSSSGGGGFAADFRSGLGNLII